MLLCAGPALGQRPQGSAPVQPRFEVEQLFFEQKHQQHLPFCSSAGFQVLDRELQCPNSLPHY